MRASISGVVHEEITGVRVAGFVGALGASAALVGFAATGTGAYFSDTHTGAINASTGAVKVNIAPGNGQLNFTNLLPGEYQTQQISYQSTGTGSEDIWLVFPTTGGSNPGNNPSEAFTGSPDDSVGGGLGRFGHLAIDAPAGSFTSYNLSNPRAGDPSVCPIDANGHGGSNAQAASKNDWTPRHQRVRPPRDAHGATRLAGPAALMDGQGCEAIASAWFVSEATVRTQIRGVLTKVGVSSQLAAAAQAQRVGWRPPPAG